MNLRDFEYLVTVARLQHFGRAALAYNVSQPTLSMQIKKLEETLGLPLVERGRRSVTLTAAGKDIVMRAENILREAKAIRDIARQYHDPFTGTMTLGAFPTLAPFLFPHIVPKLNKAHPKLKLFLVEEKTPELIQRLRAGTLDIALLALPVEADDLEYMKVLEEPFLIALSKNKSSQCEEIHPAGGLAQRDLAAAGRRPLPDRAGAGSVYMGRRGRKPEFPGDEP